MENEAMDSYLEDTLLHAPGRVKQGLLWLGTEEAKAMGLSLDMLVERAVKNLETSVSFDLLYPERCAIGYAVAENVRRNGTQFYAVSDDKGTDWVTEHGFQIRGDGNVDIPNAKPAYAALTEEWRTQLRALADERDRA